MSQEALFSLLNCLAILPVSAFYLDHIRLLSMLCVPAVQQVACEAA